MSQGSGWKSGWKCRVVLTVLGLLVLVCNSAAVITLQGITYDAPAGAVLGAVDVNMTQTGTWYNITSDGVGQYNLSGFSVGSVITIYASKTGYTHITYTFTPTVDATFTHNIYLISDNLSNSTAVAGIVVDATYHQAVEAASVTLYNVSNMTLVLTNSSSATGWYWFDSIASGEWYVKASKVGYYTSATHNVSVVNATVNLEEISMYLSTGGGSGTSASGGYVHPYAYHQVRFVLLDIYGRPLTNVNVTATPVETTLGDWDWLYQLFGIDINATPVNNTSLNGTTGSDGSIVFLMSESIKYYVLYNSTPQNINETRWYYPKEDQYTEMLWIELPPASSEINLNLTVEIINATHANISLIFVDGDGTTTNVTFYVKNETGAPMYTNITTGSIAAVISYYVINYTSGDLYYYGYNITSAQFENPLKKDEFIRFQTGDILPDFGLTDDQQNWAASSCLIALAAVFGRYSLKIGVIIVPLFAVFWAWGGWLMTPWLLVMLVMSIGVLFAMRLGEEEAGL